MDSIFVVERRLPNGAFTPLWSWGLFFAAVEAEAYLAQFFAQTRDEFRVTEFVRKA